MVCAARHRSDRVQIEGLAVKVILSAASLLICDGSNWRLGKLFTVAAYNLVRLPKLMAGSG